MEANIRYLGGAQFQIDVRNHQFFCDQPIEIGGGDTGPTPPEFLLTALATCGGYYAAQYLHLRSLPFEGLQIHISAEKANDPPRFTKFCVRVEIPGIEQKHLDGIAHVVKAGLIYNTLISVPEIAVTVAPSISGVPACVGVGV